MAIRQEVGDDKQVIEHHVSGAVGVNLPPRASSYEEWISQNTEMYKAVGEAPPATIEPLPIAITQQVATSAPLWSMDKLGRPVLENEMEEDAEAWEKREEIAAEKERNRLVDVMRSVQEDEAMDLTRNEVPIG